MDIGFEYKSIYIIIKGNLNYKKGPAGSSDNKGCACLYISSITKKKYTM